MMMTMTIVMRMLMMTTTIMIVMRMMIRTMMIMMTIDDGDEDDVWTMRIMMTTVMRIPNDK